LRGLGSTIVACMIRQDIAASVVALGMASWAAAAIALRSD